MRGYGFGNTPLLDVVRNVGGFYRCPKDKNGKRLGPIVGYAGRDEKGRQFVGDVYVNFAMAERHGQILSRMALMVRDKILELSAFKQIPLSEATGFCAAPLGGMLFASTLAGAFGRQCIYPEKKVISVATETSREVSRLEFSRHEPKRGESWWIVEDVCNNFSTTFDLIKLIGEYGARVIGIICFLNRSDKFDGIFVPTIGDGLPAWPIVSLVREVIPQYRQDDPNVASDITSGNVILKPKNNWHILEEAMKEHSCSF